MLPFKFSNSNGETGRKGKIKIFPNFSLRVAERNERRHHPLDSSSKMGSEGVDGWNHEQMAFQY